MRTTMRIDDVLALLKANEAYGVRKCIEEIEKMQEQYKARRCKTCAYYIGKKTSIGTECMQPNLQRKWKGNMYHRTARYKVPSTPACKYYEAKMDEVEE